MKILTTVLFVTLFIVSVVSFIGFVFWGLFVSYPNNGLNSDTEITLILFGIFVLSFLGQKLIEKKVA